MIQARPVIGYNQNLTHERSPVLSTMYIATKLIGTYNANYEYWATESCCFETPNTFSRTPIFVLIDI